MRQVVFEQFGKPDVLRVLERPSPALPAGHVRLHVAAAALNRVDLLQRAGKYHATPTLPFVPGQEASGTILELGEGVTGFKLGQRVLAYSGQVGFYADEAIVPATALYPIPDGVSLETAAAMPVAWLTAWCCLTRLAALQPGETALIFAAASGVGQAAIQIARFVGATVIGVAGSPDRVAWALEQGVHHGIDRRAENVLERVREITDGQGVNVALDAAGGPTFTLAVRSAAHFGRVVALANVTLEDSTLNTRDFYPKNASIHGFQLTNRIERGGYDPRGDLEQMLDLVADGRLRVHVDRRFPLERASAAHRYLESGANLGKVVLTTEPE